MAQNEKSLRIRQLNDRFRRCRQGQGRVVVTRGIAAEGEAFVAKVLMSVRSFDAFTSDNDPRCRRRLRLVWCLSNTYKLGCKFRLGI